MVELDVHPKTATVADIVDWIEKGKLNFDKSAPTNCKIFEYLRMYAPSGVCVIKYNFDNETKPDVIFNVYAGHSLINTIYKYLIQNEPFENMSIFEEYNGKSFKDMDFNFRRHVREAEITLFLDYSDNKDDTRLLDYIKTINAFD